MRRTLVATYRLQLHSDFGFDDAAKVADYLEELGISHVYSSPYLQAAPGSRHGYDVVDHHKVNVELGGAEAHARFSKKLGACHLGQVLDIVPNHMAISGRLNHYWWDVLENGPASRYASFFDIDWQSREEKLRNKLLAPVLGDHYGRAIEKGDIKLRRNGADFFVKYFDNEFPAAPRSLPQILTSVARESGSDYLAFLSDSMARLPSPSQTDAESLTERHRDRHVIGDLLCKLFEQTPFIGDAVDQAIRQINSDPDKLDHFLEEQNYRLAYWETSKQELPYRRFFDVNTLVGLRMESPHVFAETHAVILNWLREGVLDGIRVDHPDGLRDPKQYFQRLRQQAEDVWILGEKILEPGEELRRDWPINGTTGYDYLNEVGGLFVDSANEAEFNRIYQQFTGESTDYAEVCRDKKHLVQNELLGSDVNRLTALLVDIFEQHRARRDYTRPDAHRVLREIVACFPIYRTYVVPERGEITPDDERYINEAAERAKKHRPELDPELIDFVRDMLLLKVTGELETEFVMRFQQFTGPAMAKGAEDTAFYCFNRLTSLNEVGGDPGRFGSSPDQFHRFNQAAQQGHPTTMLASSTHDTKRSEDVRARISLLSEIPAEWEKTLSEWGANHAEFKAGGSPDANTEYLIYQTMIGAWPIEKDRLLAYMEKAMREAKNKTSWMAPNEEFEKGTQGFIDRLYSSKLFVQSLETLVARLLTPGRLNSLSATLLKLTSPGIPDIYQGTEIWDLSLVDPDNRRPVDYKRRRSLLEELRTLKPAGIMQRMNDGLPKLWTLTQALKLRGDHPDYFNAKGEYTPVQAEGSMRASIVAYLRGQKAMVVAPRLVMKITAGGWGDTSINVPPGHWKNLLSGEPVKGGKVAILQLLDTFPVALLIHETDA
jgi:(1->4)-alpha-D-glucan 1-alpha-D-glucosylmutase